MGPGGSEERFVDLAFTRKPEESRARRLFHRYPPGHGASVLPATPIDGDALIDKRSDRRHNVPSTCRRGGPCSLFRVAQDFLQVVHETVHAVCVVAEACSCERAPCDLGWADRLVGFDGAGQRLEVLVHLAR